jgi:hypothetical protein
MEAVAAGELDKLLWRKLNNFSSRTRAFEL